MRRKSVAEVLRLPLQSLLSPGGIDSVLKRPDDAPADETTVRPGAHAFGAGPTAYSVTWWDPKKLEVGKAPSFSIRQQELLEKGSDEIVQRRLVNYHQWQLGRAELLATKQSLLASSSSNSTLACFYRTMYACISARCSGVGTCL